MNRVVRCFCKLKLAKRIVRTYLFIYQVGKKATIILCGAYMCYQCSFVCHHMQAVAESVAPVEAESVNNDREQTPLDERRELAWAYAPTDVKLGPLVVLDFTDLTEADEEDFLKDPPPGGPPPPPGGGGGAAPPLPPPFPGRLPPGGVPPLPPLLPGGAHTHPSSTGLHPLLLPLVGAIHLP